MKRCNKCKMIMGDGAKVCLSCNQKLENDFTYICNNCGQVIIGKEKKCSRCGAPTIFASMAVDTDTETSRNKLPQNNNSKIARNFIFGIVVTLVLVGVYQLGASSVKKNDDIYNVKESNTTTFDKKQEYNNSKIQTKVIDNKSSKNNIDIAKDLLYKHGITHGSVIATSYGHNNSGFTAVLEDDSQKYIVVIDDINRIKATLNFSEELLKIGADSRSNIKFDIYLVNDTIDSDKDSGIWRGRNHILPIRAEFKRKGNGEIEPGMLKTTYKDSNIYDQYLMEQKNVDIINLLLIEMPTLRKSLYK